MSFWGPLATIGAYAATAFTGGAAAPLIPLAAGVGGAIDAHNAEKKAAGQEAAGNAAAAKIYDPYVNRGNDAGNAQAVLMGLPTYGPGGFAPGPQMAGPRTGTLASLAPSRIPQQAQMPPQAPPPQTLASLVARKRNGEPVSSYAQAVS